MTAVADFLAAVADLGVPWWGWAALLVMTFWGLLGPAGTDAEDPSPEDQLSAGRG